MIRSATPSFEIGGKRVARLGRTHAFMQDMPVGREFVVDGEIYQMITTKIDFAKVPVGQRFRRDGKWYKRVRENESRLLDPNMPLADICGVAANIGGVVKVDLLEIKHRGADTSAPAAKEGAS